MDSIVTATTVENPAAMPLVTVPPIFGNR